MHLKALSCYVGFPQELLLTTNAKKCQRPNGELKKRNVSDREASDISANQTLHQIT